MSKVDNIKQSKRGGQFKYEPSFRRKLCAELLTGTITAGDLARKYNVGGQGTILAWIPWYKQEQQELLTSQAMNSEQSGPDGPAGTDPKDLKALEQKLRLAELKIACLETLIDEAEKTLHIDIRKKSGTRSSKE